VIKVTNGVLVLDSGTIGTGAVIETNSGGQVHAFGRITNGGTLFASASGSLVQIVPGPPGTVSTVVNGGVALIGDGAVEIIASTGESVRFLSSGSGELGLSDTQGHASAFSDSVSGFGGPNHSNHAQTIESDTGLFFRWSDCLKIRSGQSR